jgi:hypothetical protein
MTKPTINFGLVSLSDFADFKRFDGVEIELIEHSVHGTWPVNESDFETNADAIYYWSVFLHRNHKHPANEGQGGVECVGDFPTKPLAESFAIWLESAMRWANEDAKANEVQA